MLSFIHGKVIRDNKFNSCSLAVVNRFVPLKVIVLISPTNTIIEEQLKRFGRYGLRVDETFLEALEEKPGSNSEPVEKALRGEYMYLIGHPEQITSETFKRFLMREPLSQMVCIWFLRDWITILQCFFDMA